MWKRERTERVDLDDVLRNAPAQVIAPPPRPLETSAPVAAPTPPPAPAPAPTVLQAPAAKASVLGATLRFKGDLTADEDLVIEGQVEGSVLHTRSLTIGSQGHVRGNIRARRVVVEGKVDGNVYALEGVTLRASAALQGDVFARCVSIETGARVRGRIDMDNAPAVPRIDTRVMGGAEGNVQDLSDQEVGALLSESADR
jgi:cytoskeletal protein CcmA (bactofilin family)